MITREICNLFSYDNTQYLWLTYTTQNGTHYYITSNLYRDMYYLWKENRKTKYTNSNPTELYSKIKEQEN